MSNKIIITGGLGYIGSHTIIELKDAVDEFIVIDNIPKFNDENSNQQNRFITLIDILYEKKVNLLISTSSSLESLGSSTKLRAPFKRTLSRLYELTSPEVNI